MKTRFRLSRVLTYRSKKRFASFTRIFPLAAALMGSALLAGVATAPVQAADVGAPSFRINDRVQTIANTPVWQTPPTHTALAGNQLANTLGTVIAGPTPSGDGLWWKVRFDSGLTGWVVDRQLRNITAPATVSPPRALPPPRPGGTPTGFVNFMPGNGATVNAPRINLQGNVTDDIYALPLVTFSINGTTVPLDRAGNFVFPVTLHPGANTFTLKSSTPNPRQQVTSISGYLDGSVVYGSDTTRAAALRSFSGGKLKTSAGDLPPLNTAGLENANDAHLFPDAQLFLCGDVRANENVELSAIQTLFVREHNQIATAIAAGNPGLSDEAIYQTTRRIVAAEIQVVTYNEFLPALLGTNAMPAYAGYNPNVNSGISTEFSTAAYRIGHTLINDDVEFLDNNGAEIAPALELADAFFNPTGLKTYGPSPLLKYLATDNTQEVDTKLVGSLRNFLFGPPGAGGFDLASLNIQRGRDHGLSDYNTTRANFGLPRVTSFAQITSDTAMAAKLASLYGNVNSIDLWVGGLAEDHAPGSSVGPTFLRILVDQFARTRDGDSRWYQRVFSGPQLQALQATRLSDIIRRNTTITKLQDNVFFYDATQLAGQPVRAGSLPAALVNARNIVTTGPALDGSGNNPGHPGWAMAGADLLRLAPAAYTDGLSSPAGTTRPSARAVSNSVCDLPDGTPANARNMSDWVYGWGQFVDHDLDLTTTGGAAFDVAVPRGDVYFDPTSTGTALIYLTRSAYDSTTGTAVPRTQQQVITINFQPPR